MDYFKDTKQRVKLIPYGYSSADKAKMLAVAVYDSVPKRLRSKIPSFDRATTRIVNGLCSTLTMWVDGFAYRILDRGTFGICFTEFEPFMEEYFTPEKGMVVLDVGANVGKYSFPSAKAVGNNGLVVAFEPHPENFQVLLEGFKLNGLSNFSGWNIALSNFEGSAKMFFGVNSGTHSLRVNHQNGGVEVGVRCLDSVIAELGLGRVDWVKIDVEGAELQVLLGAEETVSRFKPRMILEVWTANKHAVDEFLEKHGYRYSVVAFYSYPSGELGDCEYYFCEAKMNA